MKTLSVKLLIKTPEGYGIRVVILVREAQVQIGKCNSMDLIQPIWII